MAEYISKETLIDILNNKSEMALGTPKMVFASVAKMVEKLPSDDVAEVVRCKDCVFSEEDTSACIYCKVNDTKFSKGGFCSYGKRRDT